MLRAQMGSHVSTLGPKYMPYTYRGCSSKFNSNPRGQKCQDWMQFGHQWVAMFSGLSHLLTYHLSIY